MHYTIYIDKLWLMDFVINTYLLLLIRRTYGLKSRFFRILISAAGNAAVFLIVLLLPHIPIWGKMFLLAGPVNLLLLQAAFSFRTKEMVVKSYLCMNGYGLLFGGTLLFLSAYLSGRAKEATTLSVLTGSGITFFLADFYLYSRKKTQKTGRFYNVKLDFYGECLTCRGFADSGNSLYEPYRKRPVAVLEKRAAGTLPERVPEEKHYLIPFHSIGKPHGLLSAVEIPVMEVDDGEHREVFRKVVIAFTEESVSEKQDYQLILHPEFVRQEA